MGKPIHCMLVLVLIFRTGLAKTPSNHSSELVPLTVRLFNYAPGCSPAVRRDAQAIATQILHRAGIEARWVDCSLSKDGTLAFPECTGPLKASTVILRIVPSSPGTRQQFGRGMLGIAAQAEKGTDASASVFHDRAKQLAVGWLLSPAVVLGHAMAHEIGHLLLGAGAHSASGLMKAHWSRKDLARAAEGNLLFSGPEVATIRARMLTD